MPCRPNVILIEAGTNDCVRDIDIANITNRMTSLVMTIRETTGMTNATFIIATIQPSGDPKVIAHSPAVNTQYENLIPTLQSQGINAALADVNAGPNRLVYPADFTGADGVTNTIHPSDQGYQKMAAVWAAAIDDAVSHNAVQEPPSEVQQNNICAAKS